MLPDWPGTDGGPAFDFLWYRTPPELDVEGAGGLVTLTVELGPTPEERAMLLQAIPGAYPSESLPDVKVLPVPFGTGRWTWPSPGRSGEGTTGGEFAAAIGGTGRPGWRAGSEPRSRWR